ncbi:MAG TPA: hypothetical protein VLM91_17540, partial [Candidatus Methylomirabilis sp.]|nr:hypothetical protein [Candidatus Methylomirabilis sp.]
MLRIPIRKRLGLFLALGGVVSVSVMTTWARSALAATMAEAPRVVMDTGYLAPTGRTLAVASGGDFQAALDRAQPGDTITLAPGAVYTGPFTLLDKEGSGWIVIRTGAPDSRLPPPGERLDPSYAALLPRLEAASGSVIRTADGAHHYRFVGIEIRPKDGAFLTNLVQLGGNGRSVDHLPHHIIFDRCYIHGDPHVGARRGIAMNSRDTAVVDSYLSDFKEAGADSQAIASWNGPGPFKIQNNFLEAAGENVMFGGADPSVGDLVPSDIEVRGNHFAKPLAWRAGEPTYEGTPWTVKNLFELKNARRVLIDGNLFEHNWAQSQSGFAILFTVRNQDGSAPWSVVEDVTFTHNVVRHVASAINILGRDDNHPSQRTSRILISNNLFNDVGGSRWGGGGTLFQILDGCANLVIEHNTALQAGNIITADGAADTGFVFKGNVVAHNAYGIIGSGTAVGNSTLTR